MIDLEGKKFLGEDREESYSLVTKEESYSFEVKENTDSTIYLLLELRDKTKIEINIGDNSSLKMIIVSKGSVSYELAFNVGRDSFLNLYTSDCFKGDVTSKKTVNLLGTGASFKGYEYISADDSKIDGSFIVNHLSRNTKSDGTFVYLSKGLSVIDRDTVSNIEKDMVECDSSESIKGILLNEKSRINAKPVLKVSCDDVKASHGCAIGTIDGNEIYYLMSRGLTREDAFRIICRSLIAPIEREMKSEEFKNSASPILEESIGE